MCSPPHFSTVSFNSVMCKDASSTPYWRLLLINKISLCLKKIDQAFLSTPLQTLVAKDSAKKYNGTPTTKLIKCFEKKQKQARIPLEFEADIYQADVKQVVYNVSSRRPFSFHSPTQELSKFHPKLSVSHSGNKPALLLVTTTNARRFCNGYCSGCQKLFNSGNKHDVPEQVERSAEPLYFQCWLTDSRMSSAD